MTFAAMGLLGSIYGRQVIQNRANTKRAARQPAGAAPVRSKAVQVGTLHGNGAGGATVARRTD